MTLRSLLTAGLVIVGLGIAGSPGVTAAASSPAESGSAVERGRYLVESIAGCDNCHSPQDAGGPIRGRELSGGPPMKEAVFEAYAPNLTSDRATGLGGWSDDQIIRAIREGVSRDGRVMG